MITQTPFDRRLDAAPRPLRGRALGARLWPVVLAPAAIVALALAFPGHAHATKPQKGFEPTLPTDPATPPSNGAIFNVHAGYASLVEGARAHAVGDLLTIVLVETSARRSRRLERLRKAAASA